MHDCIFCNRHELDLLTHSTLCFAVFDKNPVANLHTLIVPHRHVLTPFELSPKELADMFALAHECSLDIATSDHTVEGFNFGANIGEVAGQKIMHLHFHLIPRRSGDLAPPPAMPEEPSTKDSRTNN